MFSEKYLNLSHVFLFGRRDPQEVLKKVSKKIAYAMQFLMDLTTLAYDAIVENYQQIRGQIYL